VVGPIGYTGFGGAEDALVINYPNVLDSETQYISFEFNTGTAFTDQKMHLAIGGRGPTTYDSAPYGRGLAIGYLTGVEGWLPNGCNGIAIEHFTINRKSGDSLVGKCKAYDFKSHEDYRIELHISRLNVYYALYKKIPRETTIGGPADWVLVQTGGCIEDTGKTCLKEPEDGDYGNVFIGSAFLDAGHKWSVSNMYINHH